MLLKGNKCRRSEDEILKRGGRWSEEEEKTAQEEVDGMKRRGR